MRSFSRFGSSVQTLPFHRREFIQRVGGLSLAVASNSLAQTPQAPPVIWDIHCHLTSLPGNTAEERMAVLVKAMDRVGVTRVMLSLGHLALENPSPERMRERNDEVLRAIRAFPERSYGFVF